MNKQKLKDTITQLFAGSKCLLAMQESILQQTRDSRPMAAVLFKAGIITRIKVGTGAKPMAGFAYEKIAEGLDSLRERWLEYNSMDASFIKWWGVITIVDGIPTKECIQANVHTVAFFRNN